jgi:2-aminoadipate transaminase
MTDTSFDFTSLIAPGLPAPAGHWEGQYPPFNFTGGHSAPDEVPTADLVAAATRALEAYGANLSTYFLHGGYLGHRPLRDFLVTKLKASSGITCEAGDILITSGSLQGIDLINKVLLEPGDTVIIEEATYEGCINRYIRAGVTPVGIPLDEGGMRMDKLAEVLEDLRQKGVRPKYIYVIPTVQNPTATIMSEARRMELIALATRYETAIFEDECYADLIWPDENGVVSRPPSIYALDKGTRTIHIGSFSKSIAPALRVGYVVASWAIIGQLVSCKSDAGSGALEQMVLAEYCSEHFDAHLTKLNAAFKRRLDALIEALEENFGTAAEYDVPPGGMFLWIKLPKEVNTSKLAGLSAASGISINPGADWSFEMEDATRYFRVCFAHPEPDTIKQGIAKLAEICNAEFGVPTRIANLEKNT